MRLNHLSNKLESIGQKRVPVGIIYGLVVLIVSTPFMPDVAEHLDYYAAMNHSKQMFSEYQRLRPNYLRTHKLYLGFFQR